MAGKPAAQALDRAGLEANYNTVPFDPRKPFDPSGLRIGTPSVTSRGMREPEMRQIAAWMDEVVTALAKGDAEETIARVHREVSELTAQFPTPGLDGYVGLRAAPRPPGPCPRWPGLRRRGRVRARPDARREIRLPAWCRAG